MQNVIIINDARNNLHAKHLKIEQTVSTEEGEFLLCCEFLTPSFSHFQKLSSFHHPNPPFSRLFVMENGCAEITMNGHKTRLQAGNIALLPAGHKFDAVYHPGCQIKAFHVHLHDGLGFVFGPDFGGVRQLDFPELHRALLAIADNGPQETVYSMAMSALLMICRPLFPEAAGRLKVPMLYRRLILELNSSPSPATIRIDVLARKFKITRSALSKGFQRQFGISIKSYLLRQVIQQARRFLTETDLSIDEIADSLGYKQTSHFYALFKKMTGVSPCVYRHTRSMPC